MTEHALLIWVGFVVLAVLDTLRAGRFEGVAVLVP
jgi:hypothetical protein